MIICRSPLRVSLFGGGTDYPKWYEQNRGVVVSTTIDKYSYVIMRELPPIFEYRYCFRYYLREECKHPHEIKHPIIKEAILKYQFPTAIEMVHYADLPARAGLGSSSSFAVTFINAFHALHNKTLTKRQLALEAIDIERNRVGDVVGSQDQVAASYGGLNVISFNKTNTFEVDGLNLKPEQVTRLEDHMLLVFTGFSRTASAVASDKVKRITTSSPSLNEMLDICDEAVEVLRSNSDLTILGKLLDIQWKLKQSMSPNVSNNSIDEIYAACKGAGCIGGKLLGAGGGGFFLFIIDPAKRQQIVERLPQLSIVPFRCENSGSQVIFKT